MDQGPDWKVGGIPTPVFNQMRSNYTFFLFLTKFQTEKYHSNVIAYKTLVWKRNRIVNVLDI